MCCVLGTEMGVHVQDDKGRREGRGVPGDTGARDL